MLTINFVSSIRKLNQIQETKKLKKSVTDKTIYQNTNCCVNIQKRVSKTEMIYKYYVQQIMEDLVFILTKSTFHTIFREILLEIKVLYNTKAFYLFQTLSILDKF